MSPASAAVATHRDTPVAAPRRSLLDRAALAAGCGLLFIIAFIPTAYTRTVGVLLAACVCLVVARWIRDRQIAIDGTVAALAVLYVVVGAAYVGLGIQRHNPGARAEAPVFVLWPIVYVVLITGIDAVAAFKWINLTLLAAAIAICLYDLDWIAVNVNWLPRAAFVDLQQDARFRPFDGYIQFNLNSLASLMFLTPYVLSRATDLRSIRSRAERIAVLIAVVLTLAITVLALRRALLVVVLVAAPITILAATAAMKRTDRLAYAKRALVTLAAVGVAGILVLSAATLTHQFNPGGYVNAVVTGVELGSSEAGPKARGDQLKSLTEGWRQSPLIGNGLGAVASVIRSPSQPWAYELSYNALLFKTGIIGFVLYAAGVAWLFWQGLRLVRDSPLSSSVRPVLVGSVGFLVANATNPYLQKFGYLWILFLPLAYVSFWRLASLHERTQWDRLVATVLSRLGVRQGLGESRPLGRGE